MRSWDSTYPTRLSSFLLVSVCLYASLHRIDALLLQLVVLDPSVAALTPDSAAAVAALCDGEGAGPLPPGAAFEVRKTERTREERSAF